MLYCSQGPIFFESNTGIVRGLKFKDQSRQKLKAVEVNVIHNRHAPFAQRLIEGKRRQQQSDVGGHAALCSHRRC